VTAPRAALAVATVFGIGRLRPAPGTWASAAGLPAAWALHMAGGPLLLALAAVAAFAAGLWASARVIAATGQGDPPSVVIDEVAGLWIALLPVSAGAWWAGAEVLRLWPGWLLAFLAFRLFDVWKPGPIGRLDARGDALGLMADDAAAGLAAALVVALAAAAAHGLMGA
jgi:phosphatidylglycerophosphatase A